MMYQINMLPWRGRRQRRRARLLAAMLAMELALAFGAIGLMATRWREEQLALGQQLAALANQEQRWQSRLQAQRRQFDQRERLLEVTRRRQQVKCDNQYYQRLVQQLAALLPPGLWLKSLRQREGRLQITGCGRDYQDIVEIDKRMSRPPFTLRPHWREIARLDNGVFFFRLQTPWPVRQEKDAPV